MYTVGDDFLKGNAHRERYQSVVVRELAVIGISGEISSQNRERSREFPKIVRERDLPEIPKTLV